MKVNVINDVFEPRYSYNDVLIACNKLKKGYNLIHFSKINEDNAKKFGRLNEMEIKSLKESSYVFYIKDLNCLKIYDNNGLCCYCVPLKNITGNSEPVEEVDEKVVVLKDFTNFDIAIISSKEYLELQSYKTQLESIKKVLNNTM